MSYKTYFEGSSEEQERLMGLRERVDVEVFRRLHQLGLIQVNLPPQQRNLLMGDRESAMQQWYDQAAYELPAYQQYQLPPAPGTSFDMNQAIDQVAAGQRSRTPAPAYASTYQPTSQPAYQTPRYSHPPRSASIPAYTPSQQPPPLLGEPPRSTATNQALSKVVTLALLTGRTTAQLGFNLLVRLLRWGCDKPGYALLLVVLLGLGGFALSNDGFRDGLIRLIPGQSEPAPEKTPEPEPESSGGSEPAPAPESSPAPETPPTDPDLLRDKLQELEQPIVPQ